MKLRPYQIAGIQEVLRVRDKRPVLVLPTGSGKTFTAAVLVHELRIPTLWLAHRRELIDQAAGALRRLGLRVGTIMAGVREDRAAQVQVASIQTLARRALPPAGLVVVDEAHHARSSTYEKVLAEYNDAMILGLTATPFRLDGKGLGDIFGEIVVAAYPADLCEDGTLVEPLVYAPPAPDLSGIRIRAGEYSHEGMSAAVDKPKLVGDIVATWQRHAAGKRTVAFAVDVQHSQHIVDAFTAAGVTAEHLDGSADRRVRDAVLARWRMGLTTVVSNCELFGEGFDLPALECAVLARPTASLCLHLQQIGRVMRSSDGKEGAIVLDHVGNHHRHGRVTDRLEYSLAERIRKSGAGDGRAPFRQCKRCYVICDLRAEKCPACGYVFEKVGRGELEQVGGELEQLEAARRNAPFEERVEFWRRVEAQRVEYGYRAGWSEHRYRTRFGDWPVLAGRELVDTKAPSPDQKRQVYLDLRRLCAERGWKPGRAAFMYQAKFGEMPPWSWSRLEIPA